MNRYFKVSNIPQRKKSLFPFLSFFMPKMNVTLGLIIANVLIYLLSLIFGFFNGDCSQTICNYLAIQPNNLFIHNYWWTLITSVFVHANFFHLFVNMISLFFIGKFLEMLIGKKRFFWLYILSGIFASLFFASLGFFSGVNWWAVRIFGNAETFAVGASGAIFAIAGVLAFLTPKNKVYFIAGPIIAIIVQVILEMFIKNNTLLMIFAFVINAYILLAIFSMLSISGFRKISLPIEISFWLVPIVAIVPLVIIGFFISLPIGNMAHLGGFIAGAVYGSYLRLRYKKKTQIISHYFSR